MKKKIVQEIRSCVEDYQGTRKPVTGWGVPLVGFADACDPLFAGLRKVVISTHAVPPDLLFNAKTVIAYFLPFNKEVSSTNIKDRLSSRKWASGYIETNDLITHINDHLSGMLEAAGHDAATIPATHNWIEDKLISNWSHRHVASIAGLGRFGLNNMLITEKGCSGRIGSIVTSALIDPDNRAKRESCLHKYDGTCKKCVRRCVNEALSEDSFDRFRCYEMLLKNVDEHKSLGYADVCGKCLAAVPCSHIDPVAGKLQVQEKKSP